MLKTSEIIETIRMIDEENLDIRTITAGISLLDCADSSGAKSREKIYEKITRIAENLVATGEQIEREYGIPIINKRISVTPISLVAGASDDTDYVEYAKTLDRAADTCGVNFIGGFSALVHKGFSKGDRILISSIPRALSETNKVCSSVNIATTRAGINMEAVAEMGHIIKNCGTYKRQRSNRMCKACCFFKCPGR